jgi:hypothetical protein
MKVSELIKHLEKYDPDVEVYADKMSGAWLVKSAREQKKLKNAGPCYLGAMGCVILVTAEWDYIKFRRSRK